MPLIKLITMIGTAFSRVVELMLSIQVGIVIIFTNITIIILINIIIIIFIDIIIIFTNSIIILI